METGVGTAVDRYYQLADQVGQNDKLRDDVIGLFAPDAVVNVTGIPVQGTKEIEQLFSRFFANAKENRHYWRTEIMEDGTHKTVWVASGLHADGRVYSAAGTEYFNLDSDGLIVSLRNDMIHMFTSDD